MTAHIFFNIYHLLLKSQKPVLKLYGSVNFALHVVIFCEILLIDLKKKQDHNGCKLYIMLLYLNFLDGLTVNYLLGTCEINDVTL